MFGGGSRPSTGIAVNDGTYAMCDSGSNEPPGQFVPPDDRNPPIGPSFLLTGGGSYAPVFEHLLAVARRSPAFRARIRQAAGRVLLLKARGARLFKAG